MATETLDGLSALLRGLDLGGMPQFPSADVLHQPIDIFHVYLADTLQKLVGCEPQQAYEAIQPADKTSNGDLDIVLPKLKLPDGPDLQELAADLVKKVGRYIPTLPLTRPARATSFAALPANTRVGTLPSTTLRIKHLTLVGGSFQPPIPFSSSPGVMAFTSASFSLPKFSRNSFYLTSSIAAIAMASSPTQPVARRAPKTPMQKGSNQSLRRRHSWSSLHPIWAKTSAPIT